MQKDLWILGVLVTVSLFLTQFLTNTRLPAAQSHEPDFNFYTDLIPTTINDSLQRDSQLENNLQSLKEGLSSSQL